MTGLRLAALLLCVWFGGCAVSRAPEPGGLAAPAAQSPAGPAREPLEAVGVLSGLTVWSGEVVLVGDVLVPRGSTLRILAGTTVRVRYDDSTKIDPEYLSSDTELLVRGALEIAGTDQEPVRFIPEGAPEGEAVAWAGVLLDRAEPSVIEGAEIARAETGILCIGTSPLVRGSRILGCRYGVVAQQGSSPQIRDNLIAEGEGGIFCWRGSSPQVQGNRVTGNDEEGIFADGDSRPALEGNRVSGNAIGLAAFQNAFPFDPGQFAGNREDLRWLRGGGP
ncbi:hypothetical protein DESUT3_24140 [Desulfuromonas versatilis]|uniref:Right handed beta helix domain-containing protein n=1 Tax=Desulfuromonas versatilis TaxID=2802975 RepID=A0ABN6DZ30_9BACT|nr:right-handed parallel beta-helix repeat-containing protein [Desulfuromonas versatilis]BCR05345.1 hypothetical protein DESUT3_24140 [Desulfuromonas versatilis]